MFNYYISISDINSKKSFLKNINELILKLKVSIESSDINIEL